MDPKLNDLNRSVRYGTMATKAVAEEIHSLYASERDKHRAQLIRLYALGGLIIVLFIVLILEVR